MINYVVGLLKDELRDFTHNRISSPGGNKYVFIELMIITIIAIFNFIKVTMIILTWCFILFLECDCYACQSKVHEYAKRMEIWERKYICLSLHSLFIPTLLFDYQFMKFFQSAILISFILSLWLPFWMLLIVLSRRLDVRKREVCHMYYIYLFIYLYLTF